MFAVGVDVSNGRSTVAVLGDRRTVVTKPYEVPHTADGFADLAARLHALGGEVRIVMEHTGRYYESFAMSMYRAGFFVSTVNPLAIKGYQEGISIRKVRSTIMKAFIINSMTGWNPRSSSTYSMRPFLARSNRQVITLSYI